VGLLYRVGLHVGKIKDHVRKIQRLITRLPGLGSDCREPERI
jgi:hypothetical protein